MKRYNIYHRRDGRWEGRISRGSLREGKRKFHYIFANITVVKQKKMWYNKNGDEKWKR